MIKFLSYKRKSIHENSSLQFFSYARTRIMGIAVGVSKASLGTGIYMIKFFSYTRLDIHENSSRVMSAALDAGIT